jgi:transcriptional regulator with XRE-family HTH domain
VSERRDPQGPLGAAIKAERERRKLSKGRVASRAGVTERWLLDVEAGRGNPTWGHLRCLADAMKVPLQDLMKRVEECEEAEDR